MSGKVMPADGSMLYMTESAAEMAEVFKVFSDPTRINIMLSLCSAPKNVCEIACALDMTHSAISHQLRFLRAHKLVRAEKSGKHVLYTLSDEHISSILETVYIHIKE